jgi:STE24 endopeptidase
MMPDTPILTLERQRQAREFARKKREVFFFDTVIISGSLLLMTFTGLSLSLRELLVLPMPLAVSLGLMVLLLAYSLLVLPLTFYGDFILPRRYGLLKQGWQDWLVERAKGIILELFIGSALLIVLYWLVERFPDIWWLLAALMVFLLTLLLTGLAPIVILPIFFKLSPLKDTELAQRLSNLAGKAGVKTCGVYAIDFGRKSTGANAALMGLGKTRRIALTDTMLRSPVDETEAVLAHELGHHHHGDIWKLMGIQSIAVLAGFYLLSLISRPLLPLAGYEGLGDIAALPWLGLFLFAYLLLVAPLFNAYSRHLEREADRYAVRLTGKPQAFADMMTRLTEQNLSEAEPPRWVELLFYDHPPYFRRVAEARTYSMGSK